MFQIMLGSFLSLGLMFTSARAPEDKPDCCTKNLACCAKEKACCDATTKLGCCAKGAACCGKDRGCCSAIQECCKEGAKCCDEAKACCGPIAKKQDGKVSTKKASCCEGLPGAVTK
jgi:hypothetical protein